MTNSSTGDSLVGTANNDLFTSAVGTLQNADTILDSTTTDSDILNAEVTSAGLAPRIQNVETINATGKYVTTGLDLASVAGTTTLNLDTNIIGGTATVANAASLNAETIVAKSNIGQLTVTATASGTRDTVYVDGGDSANVTVVGNSGADSFDITVAADKTLKIGEDAGGNADELDSFTVNVGGDLTIADAANAATLKTLTINNTTGAEAVVAQTATTPVGTTDGSSFVFTGDSDTVLDIADANSLDTVAASSTNTGTVTVDAATVSGATDLRSFIVDKLELSGTAANTATVNVNTTVNLTEDVTATVNIGDENSYYDDGGTAGTADDGSFDAGENTGALLLNVSEDQTTFDTGAHVGTLIVTATPDEVSDTDADEDGNIDDEINVATLNLGAQTTTVVVQGSEDFKVGTTVAIGATNTAVEDTVISAASMTGDLHIEEIDDDATVVGGAGNDTIKANTVGTAYKFLGGAGDDTLTLGSTANTDSELDGGAGNDTITGGTGDDTLKGGTGDDVINTAYSGDLAANATGGADTVTTGAGSDTVITQTGATVTDATVGEDKVALIGAAAAATTSIDLTDVTLATGKYTLDANLDVTLKGSTATDISDIVALGYAASADVTLDALDLTGLTTEGTNTVVASDFDDVIKVDNSEGAANNAAINVNLTLGAGSDTVVFTEDYGANDAGTVKVKDFVEGEDRVILEGTDGATNTAIDLGSVSVSAGKYTISTDYEITLENSGTAFTTTDLSDIVQLGSASAVFTTTGAATVTGGSFNDYIAIGTSAVVSFIDNGGVDVITGFTSTTDDVSFDDMTGIGATANLIAAGADKTADAADGEIYIFADSTQGADSSKIETFTPGVDGSTADTILADVAAFFEANLGESDGENYVAIIHDGNNAGDNYAYLINADADGIQADDITLIGKIVEDAGALAVGDIA